jgi:hypothetical protein
MLSMRKLFYFGVAALILFELANVYFIMPMPFSQRTRSIDVAYFLYSWRWIVRALCGVMILTGALAAWRTPGWRRWLMPASLVLASGVAYALDFRMSADHMFRQPTALRMRPAERSTIDRKRLVVGIEVNGDARAYPVQLIGYHHQVRDTVGGTPVLVSFCTVCRTGRVFSPIVDGRAESFRLVGMDHFNAMFEDRATGSWWRQANGEAITGPSRGRALAEIPSRQVTLAQWLVLHPKSLVMQPDSTMRDKYAKDFDYETGTSRKALTGTDTISWRDKAWVVGLTVNGESRAYDWNRLRREGVVNDVLGGRPVVLALASDRASFFAFERPAPATRFVLRGDSLVTAGEAYALSGHGDAGTLKPVTASQEFWHSWRTFHPGTTTY